MLTLASTGTKRLYPYELLEALESKFWLVVVVFPLEFSWRNGWRSSKTMYFKTSSPVSFMLELTRGFFNSITDSAETYNDCMSIMPHHLKFMTDELDKYNVCTFFVYKNENGCISTEVETSSIDSVSLLHKKVKEIKKKMGWWPLNAIKKAWV